MIDSNRAVKGVVVGAGPVGLWTAVCLKLRMQEKDPSSTAEIEVLEKNEVYQRSHVLKLNKKSLKNCPKDVRLQAIVHDFIHQKVIRTNDIELRLAKLAQELGIRIRKSLEVSNPEWLIQEYPQAEVFIGADGAHSTIRKTVFGEEMSLKTDFKYVIEVKYEIYGKAKRLKLVKEKYPTLKIMDALAQEHIGSEKNGITPITLRIFINKKKFEQMRDANFKHPYNFENEDKINARVREKIWTWINFRQGQTGQQRVSNSEKITTTSLGCYASKEVVKMVQGKTFVLVGDAAFGVPFFRSLNNGLKEGTKLATQLSRVIIPKRSLKERAISVITLKTHGMQWPLLKYSSYVKDLCKTEVIIAAIKSFFLTLLILFIRVSARIPWQFNYWTEGQVQRLPT